MVNYRRRSLPSYFRARFDFGDIIKFFCTIVTCQGSPQEPTPKSALVRVIAVSKLYAFGAVASAFFLAMKFVYEMTLSEPSTKGVLMVLDIVFAVICCLSLQLLLFYNGAVKSSNKVRFIISLTAFLVFWVLRLAYLSYWLYWYNSQLWDDRYFWKVYLVWSSIILFIESFCGAVFFCIAANYYRHHLSVPVELAGTQEMPPAIEHVKPLVRSH